ncbi:hypothetical protein [Leeuwenhoekiella parthenopeia]|uniref:Uncharacterized protein n=1 Tax=Leeuwenhoekiella parthenopeia TaxID=2890320 RepID=A0ABS8GSM9_9FLAO|nr:hypothetical protein [Leeuwenhoekiella parthenopeia]MCC4212999.1 hypothetical protein [Leeuwenhoekiella parthenopeia]
MNKSKIVLTLVNSVLFAGIILYFTDIIKSELTIKAFMIPAFLILASQFPISALFNKSKA